MARRREQTQGVKHRNVAAASRVLVALDLAIEGHDWQTIANQAGYASRGAAYDAVQRELKRRIDPRIDSLRTLQLARLGRLRTVYYPKAMAGDGFSMDRVLRLDERESALMGLDAPKDAAVASVNYTKRIILADESDEQVEQPPTPAQATDEGEAEA